MDKTLLLDRLGVMGEDRLLLAKVLDRARQAQDRNIPAATDFLSPQQQMLSLDLLRLAGISETDYVLSGGFDGAERKLILFLPDWQEPEDAVFPLRCIRAGYRSEYDLSHRDVLGSLMGEGIVREKVGDILVSADSCDVIVADSVAEFLLNSWSSAGRAKLTVREVSARDLHIPVQKTEPVKDTVAALRLDAVASSGFRMSRGKAAELVNSGRVQVNWQECTKPDRLLAEGDTVSARGVGKFKLKQVGGTTKKGRISILLERYL